MFQILVNMETRGLVFLGHFQTWNIFAAKKKTFACSAFNLRLIWFDSDIVSTRER